MSAWNSTFKTKPANLKRSAFKRRVPKKRVGHNKEHLEVCRGEPCYLRIPGICIGGVHTTVPCHSNQSKHGKGMGLKARDEFTVPGCHACHAEIDQGANYTKQEKFEFWNQAFARWEPMRARKLQAKKNPATAQTVPGRVSQLLKAEVK